MNARAIGWRWFGFLECNRRDGFRTTWLQVVPRLGLSLMLTNREKDSSPAWWWSLHFNLGFGDVYVDLPLPRRQPSSDDAFGDSWGFTFFEKAVHLHWGTKVKIVHLPWHWEWERTSYLLPNGKAWLHETRRGRRINSMLGRHPMWTYDEIRLIPKWERKYPYRYHRRSGEIQEVTASVTVREYEHRRLWLRWTKIGARLARSIHIDFSAEIGERTGSWKGGVFGCSYDMNPGESPVDCLRRMERERRFD